MNYDYMPGSVIRWRDDVNGYGKLARELRGRPGEWGVVAERIPEQILRDRTSLLRMQLSDEFEIESSPVDDGPFGVLYEISARYAGKRDKE